MMRPNFWLMRGSNRKHVGGSVGRQNQNLELQSGLSICQIPIYRLDIVNACDTTKERERERGVEKKEDSSENSIHRRVAPRARGSRVDVYYVSDFPLCRAVVEGDADAGFVMGRVLRGASEERGRGGCVSKREDLSFKVDNRGESRRR